MFPESPGLEFPPLQESDAELGVANPGGVRRGDTATAMPSNPALASTFDLALARRQGESVGAEARAKGFNVLLGGTANLIRDPRGGRTFEYLSEDPLLTGLMAGAAVDGVQSRGVLSTVKHFALNDQETARKGLDVRLDKAAARESDLLAFEIAIERGRPGAVMCAYNRVDGDYACESAWLLTEVLKGDWGYPGFVLSDWGAVHSTERAAMAGLDQELGEQADSRPYFADLGRAVASGRVPQARLDGMVARILGSVFACDRAETVSSDPPDAVETARRIELEGAVLLRNDGVLPLPTTVGRILVVGAHADRGVPSGGGSSQVIPLGGFALKEPEGVNKAMAFDPSPPLEALRKRLPSARIDYDDGRDPARAAQKAAGADAVVLFVDQYMTEGEDAPGLSLPNGQDRLVAAVAGANPRTIVVLETGGPSSCRGSTGPLRSSRRGIRARREARPIADLLVGLADPSGRLPVTFPASESQLPQPTIRAAHHRDPPARYREGASVGYRWVDAQGERPLFPFGFGLSYTTFRLGDLTTRVEGTRVTSAVSVTNAGARSGAAIPQLYLTGPSGSGIGVRLGGFSRLELAPGETRRAEIPIDPRLFATFDEAARRWRIAGGVYRLSLGLDSARRDLTADVALDAAELPP